MMRWRCNYRTCDNVGKYANRALLITPLVWRPGPALFRCLRKRVDDSDVISARQSSPLMMALRQQMLFVLLALCCFLASLNSPLSDNAAQEPFVFFSFFFLHSLSSLKWLENQSHFGSHQIGIIIYLFIYFVYFLQGGGFGGVSTL